MDVSGSILSSLDAGYPCRHDKVCVFILGSEHKIMEYLVVNVNSPKKRGKHHVPVV